MNILWVPHSPWREGAVGRDRHLIRHLRRDHRVASVAWPLKSEFMYVSRAPSLLRRGKSEVEGTLVYQVRRLPDLSRVFRQREMEGWWPNEKLFRRDLRWAIEDFGADVVITGLSAYMTGYPPFDFDIPFVFDYLDIVDWSNHPYKPDLPYLKDTDAVLCVSDLIYQRAHDFADSVYMLPNGADIEHFRSARGTDVRSRHGLEGDPIVSLIGLTVGEGDGLFFVEAVREAKKRLPSLTCLLVGHSEEVERKIEEVDPQGHIFHSVGAVSYSEVADYYAASDVGLYPATGGTYDDGRSPLKVFEYTASETPIVSTPIREVERLGFQNVVLADPTPSSFAEGICQASRMGSTGDPKIERYSWSALAERLIRILREVTNQ